MTWMVMENGKHVETNEFLHGSDHLSIYRLRGFIAELRYHNPGHTWREVAPEDLPFFVHNLFTGSDHKPWTGIRPMGTCRLRDYPRNMTHIRRLEFAKAVDLATRQGKDSFVFDGQRRPLFRPPPKHIARSTPFTAISSGPPAQAPTHQAPT